jgi:nitronate monooxygenase
MVIDELSFPVVLAPLAGGPSTPELAAAVSGAGGLGFLGAGYLPAAEMAQRIRSARRLSDGPIGVNLFTPGPGPSDRATFATYLDRLQRWALHTGVELGEPAYSDDDWEPKLRLLVAEPPEVVSFTFGCPAPAAIQRIRSAGSEVWVTVTSAGEARAAQEAGADVLVVQGAEAGGHRGSFVDDPDLPAFGLLPLLALVTEEVSLPLVASGGIATGAGIAAVLAGGARAAQLGTAFMLAPEAGTSPAHRRALATPQTTALTRAFTGRLARGIRNTFMVEHGDHSPVAYPELHYVTAPMRKQARERHEPELINLWAGEAHELALELPAAEILVRLGAEARSAAEAALVALSG